MSKHKIKPVHYLVTNAFGNAGLGDVRLAYEISRDDDGRAMVFHPALGRVECASLDICVPHARQDDFMGKPLYESLTDNSYVNLDKSQAKRFESMIEAAGIKLASRSERVVAREALELLPPKPEKKKKKTAKKS